MYKVSEIAPDVYRISVFVKEYNLQFNHFLIRDEEPLLYHAGMRLMFPEVLAAVRELLDPASIRWIGFSHFEMDECGALNEWLQIAPQAQAVCSDICGIINMADYAIRPARLLPAPERLQTGKYAYRLIATPHVPHGWDASVLFEETNKTLLCSDLFHQNGNCAAITDHDILGAHRQSMLEYEKGPLLEYTPYSPNTAKLLQTLAELQPKTLAVMHGSSFMGNCAQALLDLDGVMKELWGQPGYSTLKAGPQLVA
ncbi:hypothetical protein [Hymenobacter sp. BT730]|uniref:hypothetical protein n=1 Tax=Hymenobacter sp. BT730 TaxID=3063332 RepID=UPI0026DF1688|nr:hypothetical protein [Hymenobacter sp. BT730]